MKKTAFIKMASSELERHGFSAPFTFKKAIYIVAAMPPDMVQGEQMKLYRVLFPLQNGNQMAFDVYAKDKDEALFNARQKFRQMTERDTTENQGIEEITNTEVA